MSDDQSPFTYHDISDKDISLLIEYIKVRTSFDLNCYKLPCIKRCIARRMSTVSKKDFRSYTSYVMENEKELEALLSLITIEFSAFFRNNEAFEILRNKVLPDIIASKRRTNENLIRIWSAGCATGEEPYSISILLFELLAGIMDRFTVRIFATDVDRSSVSRAIQGIYSRESVSNIESKTQQRYFVQENTAYKIKDFIRKPVFFGVQDIINDPPISNLDLLMFRNVLIYLNRESQIAVFKKLHYAIRPGGYLCLGKAETLPREYETVFDVVDRSWRIYRKIR